MGTKISNSNLKAPNEERSTNINYDEFFDNNKQEKKVDKLYEFPIQIEFNILEVIDNKGKDQIENMSIVVNDNITKVCNSLIKTKCKDFVWCQVNKVICVNEKKTFDEKKTLDVIMHIIIFVHDLSNVRAQNARPDKVEIPEWEALCDGDINTQEFITEFIYKFHSKMKEDHDYNEKFIRDYKELKPEAEKNPQQYIVAGEGEKVTYDITEESGLVRRIFKKEKSTPLSISLKKTKLFDEVDNSRSDSSEGYKFEDYLKCYKKMKQIDQSVPLLYLDLDDDANIKDRQNSGRINSGKIDNSLNEMSDYFTVSKEGESANHSFNIKTLFVETSDVETSDHISSNPRANEIQKDVEKFAGIYDILNITCSRIREYTKEKHQTVVVKMGKIHEKYFTKKRSLNYILIKEIYSYPHRYVENRVVVKELQYKRFSREKQLALRQYERFMPPDPLYIRERTDAWRENIYGWKLDKYDRQDLVKLVLIYIPDLKKLINNRNSVRKGTENRKKFDRK